MRKGAISAACMVVFATSVVLFLGFAGVPHAVDLVASSDSDGAVYAETPFGEMSPGSDSPASEASSNGESASSDATRTEKADSGLEHESGVVLVSLQDGVTAENLNARLSDLDYVATKSISSDDVAFGYAALELSEGVSVEDAMVRLADENSDVVSAAQPNYIYRLLDDGVPASSLIAGVIGQVFSIDDKLRGQQWALEAVNAYGAWDVVRSGDVDGDGVTDDDRVTVAVIDNGFRFDHEDLVDNIVGTYNAVDGGNDVSPRFDSHGTHVCGIVAAKANNGKGVAGVSYDAGLFLVQSFEECEDEETEEVYAGASSESLVAAYQQIVSRADECNIKVVNMSLGGAYSADDSIDDEDQLLVNAVDEANDCGILTVCSSGNDAAEYGAYYNFPSDWLECAIGVIASTKDNKRADYSNYNVVGQRTKQVMAPGSNILSTVAYSWGDFLKISSRSSYDSLSGTSMASPCVAGVAALVYAANPDLTAGEVANVIYDTAKRINGADWSQQTGYGLVDANAAVVKARAIADSSKISISSADAALSMTTCTYDGAAKKPGVSVTLNGSPLRKDVDYSVAYLSNVNVGTGKVTVTGMGDYSGVITKTFTIKRAPIASIALSTTACAYNGKVRTPTVTVKGPKGGKSGQKLAKGTDYTLTVPSGRKSVGAYVYKVVGRGNYTGTKTLTFKINPKGAAISKPTALVRGLTAKWKKQATKMSKSVVTGYQVQVATNAAFTKNVKKVKVKGYRHVSKKITGLKAKKNYYVRVRTYKTVGKATYYSSWSSRRSVKTKG